MTAGVVFRAWITSFSVRPMSFPITPTHGKGPSDARAVSLVARSASKALDVLSLSLNFELQRLFLLCISSWTKSTFYER